MTMTEIEIAYQVLEDSLLEATPEEEGIARRNFARRIAEEIERNPNRADLHHKYGLCLYEIPNWAEEDILEIENAFSKAIDLDEEAIFSRIFLTHFYYDNQRYRESLATNCATDCLTNSNVPLWRCCNMFELQLCCLILLREISNPEVHTRLKQIQDFVLSVDDDLVDATWPHELLKVLRHNSSFVDEMDGDLLTWLRNTQ